MEHCGLGYFSSMLMRLGVIWLLVLFPLLLIGQSKESFKRSKTVAISSDTIFIDSLSLVPESIKIHQIDASDYTILPASSQLVWIKKPPVDSITIDYQVFPIDFSKTYQHKSATLIQKNQRGVTNPFRYQTVPPTSATSFSKLDKQGSISRGINFGNNQNLGVNSNLNLQLSGQLTDQIGILATISDENIPIQPDGNTQQLQDFDQVYIQLYSKRTRLTAGDYQTKSRDSYFLKYNKRLRGGAVETRFNHGKDKSWQQRIGASAAISRGKFARNIIQGQEGNQGPYRLEGSENEAFIIILSGTERIFIDGRELTRGQENDYVIDYNRAEIIFTAKQPITKDKRIIVEFQYSSQAFSRSLITYQQGIKHNKWDVRFDVYAEQDAKNQPLQQELTDEQREILINAGDDIDAAIASGVEVVEFEDDRVLYKLITDTINGQVDSIFVYSTNPDSARYQLRFSDVGSGNGNYVPIISAANGQVYEYVTPVNGIPQGQYEPIIVLISPKLRQMVSAGGSYQATKNSAVSFDVALSRNDLNTFSSRDDEDNLGSAFFIQYDGKQHLSADTSGWAVTAMLRHEQLTNEFREIEFFRSAEFDRDWNTRDLTFTENQFLPSASLGLAKKEIGHIRYEFQSYLAGSQYEAFRHGANIQLKANSYDLTYNGSLTETNGENFNSRFNRHKTLLSKGFKKFKVGYRDDLEFNEQKSPTTDSLLASSYQFWEWEAFIENADSATNTFKLSYTQRTDYGALENELLQSTFGQSYGLSFALLKNPKSQLKATTTYRILEVKNNTLYTEAPEENLLARLEYTIRLLKGGLTSTSFYEIGSGLEERRDFIYVEVSPGQGVYSWTDYNENGIKEQNEFEIAVFADQANYVRASVQTNDFIRTYTNQFNQSLFIQPVRFIRSNSGFSAFLKRFSDQIAYRIERKTNREDDLNRFNPFYSNVSDSNLISINSSFRNTLYFNRSDRNYGAEYSYTNNSAKTLNTTGFDGTQQWQHLTDLRYNFSTQWQLNLILSTREKRTTSDLFDDRNYTISGNVVEPKLTYQPNPSFNLIASYAWSVQENIAVSDGEVSTQQNTGLECRINQAGKGSFSAKANYILIEYNGDALSPITYDMLQGLLPGRNGTWETSYQRTLGKNLQMNLTYTGRVSESSDVVHTGGVQVRAFF